MFCINCRFEMNEEGKRFCTRCGGELLLDDNAFYGGSAGNGADTRVPPPPEMRVHGGSAGLLARIPRQSPVGTPMGVGTGGGGSNGASLNGASLNGASLNGASLNGAGLVGVNSPKAAQGEAPVPGALKRVPGGSRLRIAATAVAIVAVVTTGVFVIQRLGNADNKPGAAAGDGGTQAAAKSGGLFADKGEMRGGSSYKAVLSDNINDTDARLFAYGDRLYSFQAAGAYMYRIDAKTGESARVDEVQRQYMEPSLVGSSVFFRNSDEAVEADGASTNVYRFDMEKQTVEPVKGIEGDCTLLSSDGKAAYGLMLVKGEGWKVVRVDGKTLAIKAYPLQEEWKKDYQDGFLVYGGKFYFHNYDDSLKDGDPHKYGIRSLDLETGELAYEEAFGKISSLCVSDEGFAFVRENQGWFLPHGAAEAKSLVAAENLYKAYQADGYVWYSVNGGENSTLYRVKPDGSDLRRIELPQLSDHPYDMAGDWLIGSEQGAKSIAYRFEKDRAVLAVHNVLGALKEKPVTETVDVPFSAEEGTP